MNRGHKKEEEEGDTILELCRACVHLVPWLPMVDGRMRTRVHSCRIGHDC